MNVMTGDLWMYTGTYVHSAFGHTNVFILVLDTECRDYLCRIYTSASSWDPCWDAIRRDWLLEYAELISRPTDDK